MRRGLLHGRAGRAAILLAALALLAPPAAAQLDTLVTVVPGPQYRAERMAESLLGDQYRELWTTPIRVPLLDLDAFAGGLEPTERGGGEQTRSLRFRGADGREYAFRSVDKRPSLADEPALQGTLVADLIQDQVSSLHPGAAAVVAPLAAAAGLPHVVPQLVVMPDDPRLGEFRAEFAGMLGWVEERPNEGENGRGGFGGYPSIIGTDRLLERLEESAADRVDSRAYLTARLLDLVVNDWDRHEDQWRWAQTERDGRRVWLPIPRDRDYAFVDYDGALLRLGGKVVANAVRFGSRIDNVAGLTLNAQALDRRLLADLDWAAWDSTTRALQARLSDPVIDAAVARMPRELYPLSGPQLAAALKGRRDDLPAAARQFYALLASDVDVRATDGRDLAVVDRVADDVVEVRLFAARDGGSEPEGTAYFRRRFVAAETHEVRVFLQGGDDHAVVRGSVGESLMVRLIGGGGDDVMVDSSVVRGDRYETAFYDDRGENRLVRGRETVVDTRPYEPPAPRRSLSGRTSRDWGGSRSVSPYFGYRDIDGPIVGAGVVRTRYGFRRERYAFRMGAEARVGLGSGNAAARLFGDFRRVASPYGHRFEVEGSQLESFRFYGFGNDREQVGARSLYRVAQDQVSAWVALTRELAGGGELQVGPIVRYTNADVPDGSPLGELPRYGNDGFLQAGALAEAELDGRNHPLYPLSGVRLQLAGSAYPGLFGARGAFGSLGATASTYFTADLALPLTLALRAGGTRAWGEFPVHESAFLGGSRSVRGYDFQRFAGDGAVFGNAELRAPLAEVELLVRGQLGALALADAGRVFMDGDSPGGWHTAVGGGLWFLFQIRDSELAASALFARGETGKFYLMLGAPF